MIIDSSLLSIDTTMKRYKQERPPYFPGKPTRWWMFASGSVILIAILCFVLVSGNLGAWTTAGIHALFGSTTPSRNGAGQLAHRETPVKTLKTPIVLPSVLTGPPPLFPMQLERLSSLLKPALPGEGVWVPQEGAPAPYTSLPLVAKTFLRPDPARPSAIVTFMQYDTRFVRLHMIAGTTQPGGPRGVYGPGVIPTADQQGNALLAAFNGGFMYADGQYGMKVNNTMYAPPQPGDATIAVTNTGQIMMGAWGVDSRLTLNNPDLAAWRQNVFLLIDHNVINPLTRDGSLWGLTVLNQPWAYTWRSGLGLTAQGTLIYAEGNLLSPYTLAQALHAAGAVMAMQTDINLFWVRNFLYKRQQDGTLQITKLDPAMYGTGTEYLTSTFRDFFYLTRSTYIPPRPHPNVQ